MSIVERLPRELSADVAKIVAEYANWMPPIIVELKQMTFAWACYDDYEDNYDSDGDIGVNIDEDFLASIKNGDHWLYDLSKYGQAADGYDINFRRRKITNAPDSATESDSDADE